MDNIGKPETPARPLVEQVLDQLEEADKQAQHPSIRRSAWRNILLGLFMEANNRAREAVEQLRRPQEKA